MNANAITRLPSSRPRPSGDRPAVIVSRDLLTYEMIAKLNGKANDEGLVHRLADRDFLGDNACEFAIGIYRMEEGMQHPLHAHDGASEFYYIVSGSARFTLANEVMERGAGTAMLIPAGIPHAITATDGDMELLYAFSVPDLSAIGTVWLDD